jgi:hypothetical protein
MLIQVINFVIYMHMKSFCLKLFTFNLFPLARYTNRSSFMERDEMEFPEEEEDMLEDDVFVEGDEPAEEMYLLFMIQNSIYLEILFLVDQIPF